MDTTWTRGSTGWKRGTWLVRQGLSDTPVTPVWEMCKVGADGRLRVLDSGPTARGMMDRADRSDGL